MFDELNKEEVVQRIQMHFAALLEAFAECAQDYQWSTAYPQADFEAPPLAMSANGSQDLLNALADINDLWQTAQGTPGFPLPTLPYNFLASIRKVMGITNR
jgi:hypothetical protein